VVVFTCASRINIRTTISYLVMNLFLSFFESFKAFVFDHWLTVVIYTGILVGSLFGISYIYAIFETYRDSVRDYSSHPKIRRRNRRLTKRKRPLETIRKKPIEHASLMKPDPAPETDTDEKNRSTKTNESSTGFQYQDYAE
jgi:hypothetical protein